MTEAHGADPRGSITESARAKVNLTLRILGRRADGYHALESLVAFADFGDKVRLDLDAAPSVLVSGHYAGAISGQNLVETALQRLARAEPRLRLGAVTIEKNLPVAAGLGGGSADAAAVLRAVRRANVDVGADVDWAGIAAGLGADVPVCLLNQTAMMWGIGEKLNAIGSIPELPAVLVTPDAPVPADKTRQVFSQLEAGRVPDEQGGDPALPPTFSNLDELVGFLRERDNDLAVPARQVVPAIEEAEALLAACRNSLLVRISGAGPTCYGVFPNVEAAAAAAKELERAHSRWWIRAVTLGG